MALILKDINRITAALYGHLKEQLSGTKNYIHADVYSCSKFICVCPCHYLP